MILGIEQLYLQTFDQYLQRLNFSSLQCLTFFTVSHFLDVVEDWARESFPTCFQRGVILIRKPPRSQNVDEVITEQSYFYECLII